MPHNNTITNGDLAQMRGLIDDAMRRIGDMPLSERQKEICLGPLRILRVRASVVL